MASIAFASPVNLSRLHFRAETNPVGPAIDLVWKLPDPTQLLDSLPVMILRRERRFPGINRRGVVPVPGNSEDLSDGLVVYNSTAFTFDFEEERVELEGGEFISTLRQFIYQGSPLDRILVRTIRRNFLEGKSDPVQTTLRVIDRNGLEPGIIYYYTAFVGNERIFSRLSQASALATGRYDHALFSALPQIHQRLDNKVAPVFSVARIDEKKGQLKRFLEVFDAHADMLHGMISGLIDLHAPRRVDSRLLLFLAHLIGWKLKNYLDEDGQRNEIGFAPEVYRTVGTLPNIAAMVNRLTSWDTRVKEFARNVLMSFDESRLEELESETVYLDGSLRPNPVPPPSLLGRRLPPGSVDASDASAMFKLRTRAFDDQTAYTYDVGQPDGQGGYTRDDDDWFNRETIGIYIIPDVESEIFSLQEEFERIHQILLEFLPIQVRAVFVVQPGVVVEEAYDATNMVTEEFADIGILIQTESYGKSVDEASDQIPGWRWFVTNDLTHYTVDIAVMPVDTASRTWHTGLDQGL